jgi:carboxyl-terminal processing protease
MVYGRRGKPRHHMAKEFWCAEFGPTRAQVPPPFRPDQVVDVVLPGVLPILSDSERWLIQGLESLLTANASALRLELGAPFRCVHQDPGLGQRWFIGPQSCNSALARLGYPPALEPVLHVDRTAALIATDAPSVHRLPEAFSLLKHMHWQDSSRLVSRECSTLEQAVLRVVREVGRTWPSFNRLGLSWLELCGRHIDRVLSAHDPVPALQRWLAELGDGHTRVCGTEPQLPPSFAARVLDGRLILHDVPAGCSAWNAGARAGDTLADLDPGASWDRVGASAHHKPFLVAYRMLTAAEGQSRSFTARAPDGACASWTESYAREPMLPVVSWSRLPSGTGYLRVRRWQASAQALAGIDTAFDELRAAPGLIVDLRGNGGGSGSMALSFRDRFVRRRSHMGYRQFSGPFGELAEREGIFAEPAGPDQRWNKSVRFLTDPLTYSASEDLLLGLSGLGHVEVIGLESGGGSGQARSVRLLPGCLLTVSSCLTFERDGRCLEGAGIRVDRRVPLSSPGTGAWQAALLKEADRAW